MSLNSIEALTNQALNLKDALEQDVAAIRANDALTPAGKDEMIRDRWQAGSERLSQLKATHDAMKARRMDDLKAAIYPAPAGDGYGSARDAQDRARAAASDRSDAGGLAPLYEQARRTRDAQLEHACFLVAEELGDTAVLLAYLNAHPGKLDAYRELSTLEHGDTTFDGLTRQAAFDLPATPRA